MHVGIDLLFLVPGQSGGRETYARELLGALRGADPALRITTFLNRETVAAGRGWWTDHADRALALPRVAAGSALAWAIGEGVGVARAAARAGVDVVHGPANFAPAAGPFARVLTLHDLMYRRQRELVSPLMRAGTEALIRPAAHRAHAVITGTAVARDEIVAELGVPAERITVVPHGVAPPRDGDGAAARARLRAGDRAVVLAVASALPHKNQPALLAGLAALPAADRPLLVLAGHGTDGPELGERAAALGVAGDVRRLGAVAPAELDDLWAAAGAAATTTLHEGFGLPVLEALLRGVPVACSDLPVLREVAGADAEYVDPADPAAVARGLRAALDATPERIAAGRERARAYTWQATAERTVAVYAAARSTMTKTRLV